MLINIYDMSSRLMLHCIELSWLILGMKAQQHLCYVVAFVAALSYALLDDFIPGHAPQHLRDAVAFVAALS